MSAISKPARRLLAVLAAAVLTIAGVVLATHHASASAAIPPNPKFRSSAPFGIWDNGKFDVYNNEWNTAEAGPQTIWANSYHSWGVVSRQASTTSVKTYPSVQENYNNHPKVSSLRLLRSRFRETMPKASRNFDAEAAYDLWFNDGDIEVMLWVDNHGQAPAGGRIATAKIAGQSFGVFSPNHNAYSFVKLGKQERHGTAHLYLALRWLLRHGDISRSAFLTQVNFGWEICSTHGVPMSFRVGGYSLQTAYRR